MKKIILLLAVCVYSVAHAQVLSDSSFFSQIASDWHAGFTADAGGTFAVPVDISDGADGTLGVYEGAATLKFQGFNEKRALNADVNYGFAHYDFSGAESPVGDANKIGCNLFYSEKIAGGWSAWGMFTGSLNAETNASLSDGGSVLAGAGAGYRFSENLRVGLGVAAVSRMDRDWIPMPVAYVDWKITERLSLRTFTGAALVYDAFGDGKLLLSISADYKSAYIRLSDGTAGERRSVKDSYFQCSANATYSLTKNFYVAAGVGGNFNREMTFRTDRIKSGEIDVDAAPVFFVHAGCKF